MDLRAEAQRLALDAIAVAVSSALADEAIPHVLLKGPSTSLWLYDPPRAYRDIDVLLPVTEVSRAVAVLARTGLARPGAGRAGEEAPHSLLLRSREGCEIDLHISLPTIPVARDDRVWAALQPHVEALDIGVGQVPALDEAARCLVVALHALNSGPESGQPIEDLDRARDQASEAVWATATALADRLDAGDLLAGALAMTDGVATLPPRARLYVLSAPSAAFGLQRLLTARRRDVPRLMWRELFPTQGFMRYDDPTLLPGRRALLRAHVHRWRRIAGQLVPAVRALRTAKGPRQ